MKKSLLLMIVMSVFFSMSIDSDLQAINTRPYEYQASDDELNIVYKQMMAMLSDKDQASLKNSQKLWIKMRDEDCKWAFMDHYDCLIDKTDRRIKELKESYFNTESGEYISIHYSME